MANIQNELNNIKNAVFGKDVRDSIHDAIKTCYDDASIVNDNANMEVKMARGVHNTLGDRLNKSDEKQEELSSQLEHIANKIIEVNVKDFGAKGDGLTDDSDSFLQFINYINNNQSSIYKVTVPSGKYMVNNSLKFAFVSNMEIDFEGEIVFNNCDGLEFYFCDSIRCKINRIEGCQNSDLSLLTGFGVKFSNSCFFDFSINTIKNFKDAIYLGAKDLQPTYPLRGTYNLNIKFDHIFNCYNGIKILRGDDTAWINENRFFGGSFTGHNCIVQGDSNSDTPANSSEYNRNTFENISFEQVSGNAINFYQANSCVVKNCRPENPRISGQYLIYEGFGAKSNMYDFGTSMVEMNLVKLNIVSGTGSRIIGEIRKNTSIIGSEVRVVENKLYLETKRIDVQSNGFNSLSMIDTEGEYLFRFKRDDDKIINYFKLNRLNYEVLVTDLDSNLLDVTSSYKLTISEWQDGRLIIRGRISTKAQVPRQTDLTPNLIADKMLKPGDSNYINAIAYEYSTGNTIPVSVVFRYDGHLVTNSTIPANYIIVFDSIVPFYQRNY